ncbi:MAG TPA: hypothetical protein VE544_04660 [Nitrososphaeraceae archaeon]|nr:hypothetical protein [Nitrososphaeraceae archaeon]
MYPVNWTILEFDTKPVVVFSAEEVQRGGAAAAPSNPTRYCQKVTCHSYLECK